MLGAVVAYAVLENGFRTQAVAPDLLPIELELGEFAPGRYALRLADVRSVHARKPRSSRNRLCTRFLER